jgi:hypothetical protein
MLTQVVGRYGGADPLVSAINSINTTPKSRLIMESRQRIVGMARQHWNTHQQHLKDGGQRSPDSPPESPLALHSSACVPQITVDQHEEDDRDGMSSSGHFQAPPASPSSQGSSMLFCFSW